MKYLNLFFFVFAFYAGNVSCFGSVGEVNINSGRQNQENILENRESFWSAFFKGSMGITFLWGIFVWFYDKIERALEKKEISRLIRKRENEILYKTGERYAGEAGEIKKQITRLKENFGKIIGQENVKKKILNQFCNHLFRMKNFEEENKENKAKRRGPGVEFYLFVGEPGLGKSKMADLLVDAYSLQGKEPFIIDASTILAMGKKNRRASALFWHDYEYYEDKKIFINSRIFSYIKAQPRGFIVFNEIDKLLGDKELELDLFEFLRNIKEEGYIINDTGEKVDCSGFTFIFTSNNPQMLSEASLKTRFNIIKFETFSEEEYVKLVTLYFDRYIKEINSRVKEKNKTFSLKENVLKDIAKEIFANKNLSSKGTRGIYIDYANNFFGFITPFLFIDEEFAKIPCNKKGQVLIDYKDKSFFFVR